MSETSDSSEGPLRARYSEGDNRLFLANSLLRIAFSRLDGAIVSLVERETGAELVESGEAGGDGLLWRLELAGGESESAWVTSRDCLEFTHTLGRHRHEGELRLWLGWRGFRVGGKVVDGALTAQVVLSEDSACVLFDEEIELPPDYAARSLVFPCVGPLSHPDPLLEGDLFLPVSGGVLVPDARSRWGRGLAGGVEVSYPGPASLQVLGCAFGEQTTVALWARDGSGARKSLGASGASPSGRLQLWLKHFPVRRPDGHWSAGYPSALSVVTDGWFEAAREYRAWATQQPWAARGRGGERVLPPLTTAHGLWASYWGGARRCVSAMRELQRIVNVPIKLDWRCWHACVRNGAYPDYLPFRDGEEAQAKAEEQLDNAGVLDQLSINGLFASEESQAWREHDLAPHALQDGGSSRLPLRVMCPGDQLWRKVIAEVAGALAKAGADGILLEGLGYTPAMSCRAAGHAHRPGHAAEWTESVRALLADVRFAIGEKGQLATDEVAEVYLADVHAFFSPHAAAERGGVELNALPPGSWLPIPLFASVYHDYTTVVGPAVSLVDQPPRDPAITGASGSQAPAAGPQTQFCLEVARALVWGYQPLLEAFSPEQARDDGNRRKLAFLAAALRAQAWGIGALLPQSQFMGPVAVECPEIEADMLLSEPMELTGQGSEARGEGSQCAVEARGWGDSPASRPLAGSSRLRRARRSLPSVLGSAWRVPGGGLALVLVNIHNQAVEFAARLRPSRLNLQLPIRMMGRTFSEDGDVPAASLRASGSEISGRLPGRAIVLVSLR